MKIKKLRTFNPRFFIRELIGLYRYINAKKVYSIKNHPVNISDILDIFFLLKLQVLEIYYRHFEQHLNNSYS